MDILLMLALIAFAAGGVVAAIQKSWLHLLLFVGLFLVTLSESGLVNG
ncbi:hypothetical protein ACIBH1_42370 [Nonomuraea sp. NPDC050663]